VRLYGVVVFLGRWVRVATGRSRAPLLLTRNVNPKIVSEMLGHATIAITLDTYSHVLPNMRDAAAAAMEEALS
jgi:integrase